jgi:hypothetical protein
MRSFRARDTWSKFKAHATGMPSSGVRPPRWLSREWYASQGQR